MAKKNKLIHLAEREELHDEVDLLVEEIRANVSSHNRHKGYEKTRRSEYDEVQRIVIGWRAELQSITERVTELTTFIKHAETTLAKINTIIDGSNDGQSAAVNNIINNADKLSSVRAKIDEMSTQISEKARQMKIEKNDE